MGQSLEAFLQWKSLVSLLFGCIEAVSTESVYLFNETGRATIILIASLKLRRTLIVVVMRIHVYSLVVPVPEIDKYVLYLSICTF